MPAHPWLFNGSANEPTQEALDLVAYLDSLGRDARLAGTLQLGPSRKMDPDEERSMGIFCDCAIPRTSGPTVYLSTDLPADELKRFELRGSALFARHCSGCHGSRGKGNGPAAASLLPAPRDLSRIHFSDAALSRALWEGVRGSSMPGWHEVPANDLRALAVFVRSLESDGPKSKPEVPLSAREKEQAETLYSNNCARCHGRLGRGDGMAAGALYPRPTDFHQERPSQGYADDVLARGVPGTAMPSWQDRLNAEQRRLLAAHVRSLYRPTPPSR
jgi:mono/diheme cytochrome c family protein